jgi:ACS family hexuronate transporter-like MFS transporter
VPAVERRGRVRWVICALLFFGTTINYVDRQVLGILAPDLQREIGWSELDYGRIVIAFQLAYAVMMLVWGRILDKIGTKVGFAIAVVWWSIAGMGTALARSAMSFGLFRFLLGVGEAANFPASIKTVAEWFPKSERAFATGIFNSGTNIGAVVAPIMVPLIAARWGWQAAFIATGSLGFVWLVVWWLFYHGVESHPRLGSAERQYILDGAEEPVTAKVPISRVIGLRQLWAFACGKLLTDPIWWFYLFWIPDYLQREHGLRLTQIGLPILTIYLISDLGSVAGGWFSSGLIRVGVSINGARKWTMLACAICVLPIAAVYKIAGLWPATLLIGLAAAAHQGFSANLYTLTSDLFPSRAVGSVVGIGGMAGAIGGMLIAQIVGHVLQWTNSYMIPFFIAASAYLLALLVIHTLTPRLDPAPIDAN